MTTSANRCPGTLTRRAFVRVGLAGLGTLGLPELLRLESQAAKVGKGNPKSILVLWLWGGPSHMETFDLKPDAPSEYRGEFKPIRTNVPGLHISEHLPRMAKVADRFALLRSMHHVSEGHVNSTHTLLSGYPGEVIESPPFRPKHPDVWAVANRLLGTRTPGVPAYVSLPRTRYNGAAYLGGDLDPLIVYSNPNSRDYRPPQISLDEDLRPRFRDRLSLLNQFDTLRRQIDATQQTKALDRFQQEAARVLTSDAARLAFDIEREDGRVRDRYGRHETGQRCLLARRLIEAGRGS